MPYVLLLLALLTGCASSEPPVLESEEFSECLNEVRSQGLDAWVARCTTCADFAHTSADKCYIHIYHK